jgi:hypothetical protein
MKKDNGVVISIIDTMLTKQKVPGVLSTKYRSIKEPLASANGFGILANNIFTYTQQRVMKLLPLLCNP